MKFLRALVGTVLFGVLLLLIYWAHETFRLIVESQRVGKCKQHAQGNSEPGRRDRYAPPSHGRGAGTFNRIEWIESLRETKPFHPIILFQPAGVVVLVAPTTSP
jgi:hypothetical protein